MTRPARTIGNVRADIPLSPDDLQARAARYVAAIILCPVATGALIAALGFGPLILEGLCQ